MFINEVIIEVVTRSVGVADCQAVRSGFETRHGASTNSALAVSLDTRDEAGISADAVGKG